MDLFNEAKSALRNTLEDYLSKIVLMFSIAICAYFESPERIVMVVGIRACVTLLPRHISVEGFVNSAKHHIMLKTEEQFYPKIIITPNFQHCKSTPIAM